ncbi:MAG: prephenate dehydrogenase/arogenate dehydrogenase family protein, partial [Pseudomonadota bacterium]
MTKRYERVALIGLGLIASSMFWAMKRGNLVGEVTGYARSAETRAKAREIGLCDRVCETAKEAVEGADLIVLCVPVGAMEAVAKEIAPALAPGATVTDVGSVKRAVIDAVAPHLPQGVHFVPAHPMAGTEHSGPTSGFAELFDGKFCLVVPMPDSDPHAVERLEALWQGMGAQINRMDDAAHHDLVCAVTSHAPHLIA